MNKRLAIFISIIVVIIAAIVGFNFYRSSQSKNESTNVKTEVRKKWTCKQKR